MLDSEIIYQNMKKMNYIQIIFAAILIISLPIMLLLENISLDLLLIYMVLLIFISIIFLIYSIFIIIPMIIKMYGWEKILIHDTEKSVIIEVLKREGFQNYNQYYYKDALLEGRVFAILDENIISFSNSVPFFKEPVIPFKIIKGHTILFWERKYKAYIIKMKFLDNFKPEDIVYF